MAPDSPDDSNSYADPPEITALLPEGESLWWGTLNPKEQGEYTGLIARPLLEKPDLLIVGAGLAGLATGYLAAEKGLTVQILDNRPLAQGIPDLDAGMIWPTRTAIDGDDSDRDFLFYCRDAWSRLTVRPGMDLNWKVCGLLATPASPMTHALLRTIEQYQADGWPVQEVEPAQFEGLEPAVTVPSSTGLFCPGEGILHPLRSALSFLRRIIARNGACRTATSITSIEATDDTVQSVTTPAGKISPRQILFATSSLPAELAKSQPAPELENLELLLGLTEQFPSLLKHALSDTDDIQQLKTGELVIGSLQAPSGDPEEARKSQDQRLRALFADEPLMRCVKQQQTQVQRPKALQPNVSQLVGLKNAWWLPGLRDETLQYVGTGQLILDWITTGTKPERLSSAS